MQRSNVELDDWNSVFIYGSKHKLKKALIRSNKTGDVVM